MKKRKACILFFLACALSLFMASCALGNGSDTDNRAFTDDISSNDISSHRCSLDIGTPNDPGVNGNYPGVKTWLMPITPNGLRCTHNNYSIGGSPNGDIYASGSDYATNSALYKLDHRTDILWYVGDAKSASERAGNWLPGETVEKFHCRPIYYKGRIYLASADYSPEDAGYLEQRGFHWYAYDIKDNNFIDLSASEPEGISGRVSIMATEIDEDNGILYGIGQPVPYLYAYNIAKKVTTNLGVPPFAPEGYYTCSRYLWLDKYQAVYFTIKPFNYICSYTPGRGFDQIPEWPTLNQFSTNIRNGVWSIDKKYHFLADYEGHVYKFSVDDITWDYIGQASTTESDHYKHFPLGDAFRIRSMSLSADGRKIYFLNDEAARYSLFEFDVETQATIRLCYREELDGIYQNTNYNDHAGHNAWDLDGNFYFSSFGYNMPEKVTVTLTRVNPVKLKVALGLLPELVKVNIGALGNKVVISRTGSTSQAQEVILSIESKYNNKIVYKKVIIPAGSSSVKISIKELSINKKDKVKVVPNGNNYIAGEHDELNF
ncbi:MAG: hypothetical protein JXB50_04940 [Spirochaetes bacterium]|nr:hypothetical protein [Spirochaetota bacterium]